MIGHLQHSLGIKLQWEKPSATQAGLTAPAGLAPAARPLGGAAARRRLRHVSQVALRGLDVRCSNGQAGYVLELAAEGGVEALERSDSFRTQNPTWEPVGGINRGRHLAAFELRAVFPDVPDEVLWRKVIRLRDLEPLHCEDLAQLRSAPAPAVPLVQLGTQWFACPSAGAAASDRPAPEAARPRAGPAKQVAASDFCRAGDHVSAMVARLRDLEARSSALRESMGEPLARCQEQAQRRARHTGCEQRVRDLRRELSERQAALEALRGRLESARGRRGGGSESSSQAGRASCEVLASDRDQRTAEAAARLAEARGTLQALWMQLRCRQMRMLHEVSQVYPIEDHGRYRSIRALSLAGVEALSRQDLREEENVSTALGFLAHLVVTMANILQVPLRVELRDPGSSRSSICDPHEVGGTLPSVPSAQGAKQGALRGSRGAAPGPREWPLYYGRGLERPRFETALRLLGDGLLQFLYSRGHTDERRLNGSNLLECAELILRREMFGPDAL